MASVTGPDRRKIHVGLWYWAFHNVPSSWKLVHDGVYVIDDLTPRRRRWMLPKPKDTLWDSEPRTLIKHQVYRRYLQCWMGKICRKFDVSGVVDAFSGPGQYRDGPDGSPVVIAKTFLGHAANDKFKRFRLVCLDERADRAAHLKTRLAPLPSNPKFSYKVMECGEATQRFSELTKVVHYGPTEVPTLWILDPFDWSSVPFDLVRGCLTRPRDEVMVTWFADEIYRFTSDPNKFDSLNRHFGGSHWTAALSKTRESDRKTALLEAYQAGLRRLPQVRTNAFSISSKNETARYSLVYATHSDDGLACFNPVGWKLDPVQGKMISERRGMDQQDLFAGDPVIDKLQRYLLDLVGTAVPFDRLLVEARRLGYVEKHLRLVLDALAVDGVAIRESPLEARSRWPAGSVIRFYRLSTGSES